MRYKLLISLIFTCSSMAACEDTNNDDNGTIVIVDMAEPDASVDSTDMSKVPDMVSDVDMVDQPLDMTPNDNDDMDMAVDMEVEHDAQPDLDTMPQYQMPTIADHEVLEDINPDPDVVEVNLEARLTSVDIGNGIVLDMMAYNGIVPGPLLQAKQGDRIIVNFTNNLDEPTTIHWHGLRIPDDMDGSPRIQNPVQPGESFTYSFIVPDAGTYWYHPHVNANEQVEKGLYAPIVIHDPADPEVDVERIFMVDDILLDDDDIAPFFQSHMESVHGRNGNTLLINGSSEIPVEAPTNGGLVERWRIINSANARTFSLGIPDTSFKVISSDGGVLPEPYVTDRLQVAVGQRYDVEVLTERNKAHTLTAYIPTLNAQNEVVESTFDIAETTRETTPFDFSTPEPRTWQGPALPEAPATRQETYVLDGYNNAFGQLVWTINGKAHSMEPLSTFTRDEVVEITIQNNQGPEHPFHLHGQFFIITDDGSGQSVPGLKDTVLVPGRSTVKIIAYMSNPGMWMAHCHILEHAELGMMSEIEVLDTMP